MKNITLSIPDHKLAFFTELLNSLGFVTQDVALDKFEIPEEHRQLVLDRMANSSPETLSDWDEFQKELDSEP